MASARYDPRDYGAYCDGVRDDSRAVQTANAQAQAGPANSVLDLSGTYLLARAITVQTRVEVAPGGRVAATAAVTYQGLVTAWEAQATAFTGTAPTFAGGFSLAGGVGGPAGGDLAGTYPAPTVANGAITAAKLAAKTVGAGQIADAAVGASQIAPGAVGAAEIAGGAVGTTQLAAGAVTQTALGNATATVSTTSTTYVDLDATNAAVTLATTGGDLLVILAAAIRDETTGGHGMTVALSLDGAAEVGAMLIQGAATLIVSQVCVVWRFTGVPAGNHTVKGRWLVGSAGDTIDCVSRTLLVEELKR